MLFYGRWMLGEGLSLGERWDITFMLSGALSWVGQQAWLNVHALSLWEGQLLISQAITKQHTEARGPGHPCSCPLPLLFRFCSYDGPPWEDRLQSTEECVEEPRHTCQTLHWDWASKCGWNHSHRWEDLWVASTPTPHLHQNVCLSDRSSVSTSSSVSSWSNRARGSRHPHLGWCCRESRDHMKINLPVFKDEDKKDAVTCQSWHWDLMVYHCTGCWDHTLLPYIICSLQGYPGELVRSSGTGITWDGILAILDEHYNNVKALDALNQELFQLQMGEKEMVSELGVHLFRHLQILTTSFLECILLDHVTTLKHDCFYGGLPKWFKVMVSYLKARGKEKSYSNYIQAVLEAKKEEAMEASCNPPMASTSKPRVMSFFPLQKLKGSQPAVTPSAQVVHLEEENTDKEEYVNSEDPDGIKGITEEFIVHLTRAVKDAQQVEKHFYHCGIPDHFICDCSQLVGSRMDLPLNWREGMALKKGAQTHEGKVTMPKVPQDRTFQV